MSNDPNKSQEDEIWEFIKELDKEFESWGKEKGKSKKYASELGGILFPRSEFKKAIKRLEPQIVKIIPPVTPAPKPDFKFSNYISPETIHPKYVLQEGIKLALAFPSSSLRQRRVEHKNFAYHKFNDDLFGTMYTQEIGIAREIFHEIYIDNDYKHWGEPERIQDRIKGGTQEYLKKREDFVWEEILKNCRLDWIDEHPFIEAERRMRMMKVPPPYEVHTSCMAIPPRRENLKHVVNPWIGKDKMLVFSGNVDTIDIYVSNPMTVKRWQDNERFRTVVKFFSQETPVVLRPSHLVYAEFDPDKALEDFKYVAY